MKPDKQPRERGAVWVWLSSLCLAAILTTVAVMLLVVVQNGIGVFWPSRLALLSLADGTRALGEVVQWQASAAGTGRRVQLKIGNRDLYGLDFRWFEGTAIRQLTYPATAVCVERREYGNFYGFLVEEHGRPMTEAGADAATFVDADGREKVIPRSDVVESHYPNTMSLTAKLAFCLGKVWELLSGEPREANTEGGLFPAIVGTVTMVFIMSIFSFPLGVITAIYLREYARDGLVVRLVRIAVSNLAGIPSIVYGIFGLGFFVYGVGGALDRLLFAERLPTPTFGTGGILWASLTLALLTVPVVIVATEEAFAAVPNGIREASLALGATKLQTLVRVLLPMASPGILTGFILAMARAAGEVAPLMITGVVKLAPSLPVDGGFPYIHLNRKFMHLGFHIYDVGFQSPNVEAAKPMVFVTTLLLVLIVLLLSSAAIVLRNRMKKRYTLTSF